MVKFLVYFFCIQLLISCKKDNGEKIDENPGSTFKAILTFAPEAPGTNATNQNESTISNISITSVQSPNDGIDSLRIFSVSFNGTVTSGTGGVSHPDYLLDVCFKAPKIDDFNLKTGTYTITINSNSSPGDYAGILSVRNVSGYVWSGEYPAHFFTNLPYSKVTISKSYRLNLQTLGSTQKKTFVDGTIDAYFVASSYNESSEVHIVGTFSGAEIL